MTRDSSILMPTAGVPTERQHELDFMVTIMCASDRCLLPYQPFTVDLQSYIYYLVRDPSHFNTGMSITPNHAPVRHLNFDVF